MIRPRHIPTLALTLAVASSAVGQIRPPYQRITAEEVIIVVDSIASAPSAVDEALAAHARYVEAIEASTATLRALRRWNYDHRVDLMYFRDPEALTDAQSALFFATEEKWQWGARRLERAFFDDLRQVAPHQGAAIDAFARAQRRRNIVDLYGMFYYQPVYVPLLDVVAFARDKIPQELRSPEVERVLLEYELAIDPLLMSIDNCRILGQRRWSRAYDAVKESSEGSPVVFDDVRRQHFAPFIGAFEDVGRVRAFESRALAQLASLLPQPFSEEIRAAHNSHLFDWIEQEGMALRQRMEAAISGDDLPEDTRARLEALNGRFLAERHRAMVSLVPQLGDLLGMDYLEGWYEELIRVWQMEQPGYVEYRPHEILQFEDDTRKWRERVREFERELNDLIGAAEEEIDQ